MIEENPIPIEIVDPLQSDRTPTNWWAIVAAMLVGILFDILFVRGEGGAGYAVFFAATSLLYVLGTLSEPAHRSRWLLLVMLLAFSFRLVWLGNSGVLCIGILLLPALAMSCVGLVPYLTDWWVYCLQSMIAATRSLAHACLSVVLPEFGITRLRLLAVIAPVFAVGIFGLVFVQANPDLAKTVGTWFSTIERWCADILRHWDFGIVDVIAIGLISWLVLGQLVPLMRRPFGMMALENSEFEEVDQEQPTEMYYPIRNTLIAVNVLFLLYLVFEFHTLWFRQFPKGFYYAGYAHQGAAWLTLALSIATVLLSAIFHGATLHDPRLESLKRWAWGWSLFNLLLAVSVYNRLFIYVNFNGMTRMRMVGFFGISTVVVGFLLVVWKIHRHHRFVWLLQRHLWTLALAVYLLVLTPVDYLVHQWNVRQILSGHLAPAVQITEHPVDPSGWLALVPLLESDHEIIREGIRAQLSGFALRGVSNEKRFATEESDHWTAYQIVHAQLEEELRRSPERWQTFKSNEERAQAWARFKEYAYQWY